MRTAKFAGNSSRVEVTFLMNEEKTLGQRAENLRRQAIALLLLEEIEGKKVEKELDPEVRQMAQEIAAELEGLSVEEKINRLFDLLLSETEVGESW
jgi:hypothetical protein